MKNIELLNLKKIEQRELEYYIALADKLEQMNKEKNLQHLEYIITSLRNGNIKEAKADCFNQSDKFDSIPEIKEIIKKELFEENEKHPWYLFEK